MDHNKEMSPGGHFVAAGIALVLAVLVTGLPMLAIASGHPPARDLSGYFLTSVALAVFAIWLAITALSRQIRVRRRRREISGM